MKIKKQLAILKNKAWELKNNGQIPSYLFHLIVHLDETSDIKEVYFLKEITENAMRVKFFYKNHKELEHQVSKEIEELYKKFLAKMEVENNG